MKSCNAIDPRFCKQLVCLVLLVLFPACMISVNGLSALRGILSYGYYQARDAKADSELQDVPIRLDVPSEGDEAIPEVTEVGETTTTLSDSALMFGVFDPKGIFANDRSLSLRHLYVSWIEFDEHALVDKLRTVEQRGFKLFLTIEPWPAAADSRESLLPSITQGHYDHVIDRLCRVLSSLRGPVYVSWGHEMDQDLTERYPWSAANPTMFLNAYKYVVDRVRSRVNTELNWVWAGVLKEGSLRYWPGSEYVDFIGMPIYCYAQWDQKNYGYIRDFPTDFKEKLQVVKQLDLPIIITEMGVSGSADFESFWLHQAFKHFADFPSLKAVLFFYDRDVDGAWGKDIATPDWRVHPDSIRGLVNWTNSQRLSRFYDESNAAVVAKPRSNHDQK